MQRNIMGFASLGAMVLASGAAQAGGLDRSGQSIAALFGEGTVAELSFSGVDPAVEGVFLGLLPSGDVAPAYTRLALSFKTDLNDKISAALIMDQPFGAEVEYTTAGYPLAGTAAHVLSSGITLLGNYQISDAVSVHAGLRSITLNGDFTAVLPAPYTSTYGSASDISYVVGAAFEKPEIALRVALTYATATSFALDGSAGDVTTDMPQSVNLEFQSGIAANTLVFGSIRWADWTETEIIDSLAGSLLSYDEDVITYSIGVGRKFSDAWSGALTLGYEAAQGGLASNLTPTDGYLSLGLGGTYTRGNMKISGGVTYIMLGDATTDDLGAEFTDNTALGAGVKVAFTC